MMHLILLVFSCSFVTSAAEWLTFGGDSQRTGWARGEEILNPSTAKNLMLEWKIQLDNTARDLTSLTAPLLIEKAVTPRGWMGLVIVAGSSDNLYAIDADTGKLFWKREFRHEGKPLNKPHWLCPNALNATPAVDKRLRSIYLVSTDGKLRSINYVNGEDSAPPVPFVKEFSKNWSLNLSGDMIYTAIAQGCNGSRSGIYAINRADPEKKVLTFYTAARTTGGGIWGRAGVALTSDGKVIAETGDGPYDPATGRWSDTFLGVDGKTLALRDYYTPVNRAWISRKDLDMGNISPVVFPFKNWELIAGSGKEGVIFLLDAKKMGGEDHRTPLYRSPVIANEEVNFYARGFWGALTTYEDEQGTRWLYAPAWGPVASTAPKFPLAHGETEHGSIMAFKVVEKDGKPALEAAWISRDMAYPEPPVVANGVVFALANGANEGQVDNQGNGYTTEFRATHPVGNATLHAFDAKTGQEIWNSGKTIPGWTHFSGLGIGSGRVFVSTWDSMVYAFSTGQP